MWSLTLFKGSDVRVLNLYRVYTGPPFKAHTKTLRRIQSPSDHTITRIAAPTRPTAASTLDLQRLQTTTTTTYDDEATTAATRAPARSLLMAATNLVHCITCFACPPQACQHCISRPGGQLGTDTVSPTRVQMNSRGSDTSSRMALRQAL